MSVPSHRAAAPARTASALPASYHPPLHSLGAVARTASHLGGGQYGTASMARTASAMDLAAPRNTYAGSLEPPPHFGGYTARDLYALPNSAAYPVGYSAMDLYGAPPPTMGLTARELYGGIPPHPSLGYTATDLYGGAGGGIPRPVYPLY
jgi:hypothetical protein